MPKFTKVMNNMKAEKNVKIMEKANNCNLKKSPATFQILSNELMEIQQKDFSISLTGQKKE